VFIRPGESTVISIRKKLIKKYPYPYSECIDLTSFKSDLYDYMMQLNQTYRQEECFNLCIQQTVIDKCKCYDLNYQNLSTSLRPCLTLDDFDCLEDQWQKFDVDKCIESSCPLECNSVEYKLSLSTLEFPSVNFYKNFFSSPYANNHANFFNKTSPPTYEFFKANSLGFQVYYPSLEFTQITESPK
jgi:hypothetical protein